jgi:hypothetical protein
MQPNPLNPPSKGKVFLLQQPLLVHMLKLDGIALRAPTYYPPT